MIGEFVHLENPVTVEKSPSHVMGHPAGCAALVVVVSLERT
jgi:hypothetical protein